MERSGVVRRKRLDVRQPGWPKEPQVLCQEELISTQPVSGREPTASHFSL